MAAGTAQDIGSLLSPYGFLLTLALLSVALVYVYLRALPRVLPGIPHLGNALKLFGDAPQMAAYWEEHGQNIEWMTLQTARLRSPLIQLFLVPFARLPLLVLNDYREGEDICTRRTHEFDVAPITFTLFSGVVPNATISMPSHHEFKAQRRLWAGTMSTEFLHRVAAPRVFASAEALVELWRRKTIAAHDNPLIPFNAKVDLRYAALDAIWAAAVGSDLGGLAAQKHRVDSDGGMPIAFNSEGAAVFPEAEVPPLCAAVDTLMDSMAALQANPLPKTTIFFQSCRPSIRSARELKNRTMRQLLREGRTKYSGRDATLRKPTCAMEQVLQREAASDEKPPFGGRTSEEAMIDELFVWLVAGHETTVTTLSWGLKYLADNADVQRKLRAAVVEATGTGNVTSSDEILTNDIPYLEAVIWEMLRLGRPAGAVMRAALVDTHILGHRVPKGAQILISTSGFSALDQSSIHVNEWDRSKSSQAASRCNAWNHETLRSFLPERWLKIESGKTVLDLNAGPSMTFGAGSRGCFGRRLALIELKIFVAQLILAFDFKRVPDCLNSYVGIERVTRQPKQAFVSLAPLIAGPAHKSTS